VPGKGGDGGECCDDCWFAFSIAKGCVCCGCFSMCGACGAHAQLFAQVSFWFLERGGCQQGVAHALYVK
jgi:hypothetical protein